MELIECRDLSIGYGSETVQNHISFTINKGDYVCIIGENGSGKTTLVKTLLDIIPALGGEFKLNPEIKEEGIGYLPQQDAVQRSFPTTVMEVVLSGRQNKTRFFYTDKDKKLAEDKMKDLGIYELKNKSYSELSGGQQQRVLLARALCVSDKLLVLDEPITGLDLKNQEIFYDLCRSLNQKGTTIIMISHDSAVFSKSASHILEVTHDNITLYSTAEYLETLEKTNG